MLCHFDQFPGEYLIFIQCLGHRTYSEMVYEAINAFLRVAKCQSSDEAAK